MTLGSEADAIIRRLVAVARENPVIDQERANRAIAKHFQVLGMSPLPIRWVSDAEVGYITAESAAGTAAGSAAWSAAWSAAGSAAWTAAWSANWTPTELAVWSTAELAARSANWTPAELAVWSTAELAAGSAAWTAAESAAWTAAKLAAGLAARSEARSAAELAVWSAAWTAARSGAASAAWSATIQNYLDIWFPFVDAFEAGLWLFWVLAAEILAVPRPVLRISGTQLHCADGPAVRWPRGAQYYFLHGVQVPEWLVLTPAEAIDPRCLLREQNVAVKREIVWKIGIERLCRALDAKVIQRGQDHAGQACELLMLNLGDGRKRPYLKLKHPGMGIYHIEGVPPECDTLEKAFVFRNGTSAAPTWLR